jgi:hypothetical protein
LTLQALLHAAQLKHEHVLLSYAHFVSEHQSSRELQSPGLESNYSHKQTMLIQILNRKQKMHSCTMSKNAKARLLKEKYRPLGTQKK